MSSIVVASPTDIIKVLVDDKPIVFDIVPTVINGRTLVPLRAIFEALSGIVTWDEKTNTVKAVKSDVTLEIQIDNSVARVNDKNVNLDVPPQIIDGRTLVPLRFISESFGATVDWNPETNTIKINTLDKDNK